MTPRWTIRRDEYGRAVAIEFDGRAVRELDPGTEQNEAFAALVVGELNRERVTLTREAAKP
jgi:hypothetical protein